jgi:hypothetical protein
MITDTETEMIEQECMDISEAIVNLQELKEEGGG